MTHANYLWHGDNLDFLADACKHKCRWSMIFADPPDNIGLGYDECQDKVDDYHKLCRLWIYASMRVTDVLWWSFNARHTCMMGSILHHMEGVECKPCVQTFTFGQHNKNDFGNNHRPLWRISNTGKNRVFPEQIKVPSWRQLNGDKRAKEGGRVPGDVHKVRGTNLRIPDMNLDEISRVLGYVDKGDTEVCWEWLGGKRDGYGRIRIGGRAGKLFNATRLVWKIATGNDPGDSLICHSCDNPGCCNPNHLFLGTDGDNNEDKETKSRGNHPKGTLNGLSKLTDDDVLSILESDETNVSLGKKYGVTNVAISAIRLGKTWRHIARPDAGDVFDFPRVTGNSKQRRPYHPTQLHEELVERCIKSSTLEGDQVLDIFGGTGTTLRVCKRINRSCTLVEMSSNYCAEISKEHDIRIERVKTS